MSYILDALKKTDRDRRREAQVDGSHGSPADDTDAPPASALREPRAQSPWPRLILAAMLLNAAVALWWLRPWEAPPKRQPVAAFETPAKDGTTAGPTHDAPAAAPAEAEKTVRAAQALRTPAEKPEGDAGAGAVAGMQGEGATLKARTAGEAGGTLPAGPGGAEPSGLKAPEMKVAQAPAEAAAPPAAPAKAPAAPKAKEAPKLDAARAEAAKPEPVKPERAKPESRKPETMKTETAGTEPVRPDPPRKSPAKPAVQNPFDKPVAEALEKLPVRPRESVPTTAPGASAAQGQAQPLPAPPASARETGKAPAAQNLRQRSDLPAPVQQNLPKLSFSMLVYSEKSSERMVGINGRIYREGQEISTGLKVEEITRDGVVLNYMGYKIHKGVF